MVPLTPLAGADAELVADADLGQVMDKEAVVAAMKADLRAMAEEIEIGIGCAVERTLGRLSDSVAIVEAKSVQIARQPGEVRSEIVQTNNEVAGRAAVEPLTAVAKLSSRIAPLPQAGPRAQESPASSVGGRLAQGPHVEQMIAPRRKVSDECSVLLVGKKDGGGPLQSLAPKDHDDICHRIDARQVGD